jgi:hypothetical protein
VQPLSSVPHQQFQTEADAPTTALCAPLCRSCPKNAKFWINRTLDVLPKLNLILYYNVHIQKTNRRFYLPVTLKDLPCNFYPVRNQMISRYEPRDRLSHNDYRYLSGT